MPERVVVAFDFDGTLSRRDSLLPFLQHVCGAQRLFGALARRAPGILSGVARGSLHRDASKDRLLVHLLAGLPAAEVQEAGRAYAAELLAARLRPDTVARARWHAAAGHELVMVSASPAVYLEPLGARLGFVAVLATQLEVDADGRLTGRMSGRNCRGPEKVARLERWLADEPVRLWAYGDSSGDRQLLARADVAVRVGRRPLPLLAPPAPA